MDEKAKENPLFVNSVAKCMAVLRAFTGAHRHLGLQDISKRSGLDKSTVQRMVHTLVHLGYLERHTATRRYALGTALLDFSFQFIQSHPLVELATQHLIELRKRCEERVDLSLFDGSTIVYVMRQPSRLAPFYTTVVGRRMPIFCTAGGRAMLARLPRDEARRIIAEAPRERRTPHTLTDIDAIMARIDQARVDGWSMAVEEAVPGDITLAGALVDEEGAPLGAVHIAARVSDWTPAAFAERMRPLLMETMEALNPPR